MTLSIAAHIAVLLVATDMHSPEGGGAGGGTAIGGGNGGGNSGGGEDVAFFDAMMTELKASYCIDTTRVFVTGHSFGAYMSNQMGCDRGSVVRGVAAVSGGIVSQTCSGPVAVWLAHGIGDGTVETSEGEAARDRWITTNSCSSTTTDVDPSPCKTYDNCSAGHPTTWCAYTASSGVDPHYPPTFAREAIWDFIKQF